MKAQYQTDCDNRVTYVPQKKKEFQYNTKQPEINVLQNYESHNNKIESIPGHIRSKSYEHDYFTKALNTFGINVDQSQQQPLKTKRQHSIVQEQKIFSEEIQKNLRFQYMQQTELVYNMILQIQSTDQSIIYIILHCWNKLITNESAQIFHLKISFFNELIFLLIIKYIYTLHKHIFYNKFIIQKFKWNTYISQKENDPGFISPKFRFESCDTVVTRKSQNSVITELQECVDLSKVTELSMQSVSPCKIQSELHQKIEAKDCLIDELQKQLTSTLKNMTQQIDLLRNEKNKIIQQQVRQIEIYEQQLQECRQEIQSKNKEIISLKKNQKDIRKLLEIRQDKHLINSTPQNFISKKECNCSQLERENKALLAKVDQFRQQLHELKQNLEFTNLSINNQISVIEKGDLTQFEKTFKQLADELNLTIDSKNINSSFSLLNQEVIEGVKSLKQQFKENEKFIRCLKDLVIQCAPQDYFCQSDPSLKEVWKFIKQILQSYLEHKKQAQLNEDIVFTLCKYFRCNKGELNHKGACLIVDQEVYLRIVDKIKRILNLTNLSNIRELDRKLDYYLL